MMQGLSSFVKQSLRRNAEYLKENQKKLTVGVGTTDFVFWRDGSDGPVLGTATFRSGKKVDVDPAIIAAAMA